ncbi:MAG: phosphate signaling complex protein PhoU [Firmicutes bacterium]|nr:phosphate signaling complex protein PhoU [Bacillota bacterium]
MTVPREALDAALRRIEQSLLTMGGLVEKSLHSAVRSLLEQDLNLARQVVEDDDIIDELEVELERQGLQVIAMFQPVARDLRRIYCILRSIRDLERMGDLASNIAETTIQIGDSPLIKPLIDIPHIAKHIEIMVQACLDSFVHQDAAKAREVLLMDHSVDETYHFLHEELLGFVAEGGDSNRATQAVTLLFVARFLERIGDHATNIAESVVYYLTGERLMHADSDDLEVGSANSPE